MEAVRAERALSAFVLLAVAIPLVLFAAASVHLRGERLAEAERDVAHVVTMLEEHARRVFEAQRLIIERVDERIQGMGWAEIRASEPLHQFLAETAADSPHVDGLWLVPPDGRTANSSDVFPMPEVDATVRDYFRALKTEDELFFGEMIIGFTKGNANFNLSRRRSPREEFDGLILVTASLDYFTWFWKQASGYERPVVAFAREDGEILARHPWTDDLPGRLPTSSQWRRLMQTQDVGLYTTTSWRDGNDRIYGFARVSETPIFIGLGVEVSEVLAPWRKSLFWRGLVALTASGLLGASAFVAVRQGRRLREAMRRWRATAEDLRVEVDRRVSAEEVAAERAGLLGELRRARDERKTILDSMLEGVVAYDAEGRVTYCNAAARRILGLPSDASPKFCELARAGRFRRLDGAALDATETPPARLLRGEAVVDLEARLELEDGRAPTCRFAGALLSDEHGGSEGCVVTFVDISEEKANEERRALLMGELDHRVRNMLATITAMIRISSAKAPNRDALVETLTGRVGAMTRTHGLITRSGWRGASLRQIVRDEVAPYEAERRVSIEGRDDVLLAPKEAVDLALVIHELATNAAKYGAWSNETGRVEIAWTLGDGAAPHVSFHWRERGGPPVSPPARKGFGSALIRSAFGEASAKVDLRFEPEGVVCEIRAPLRREAVAAPMPPAAATLPVLPAGSLGGVSVLVVEDEPAVRLELAALLEDAGARVVGPAPTLEAAWRLLEQETPDMALLDVNVNGENVSPLAEALRRKGVPVAFATGYPDLDLVASSLRHLPRLQKPFAPTEVVACVAAVASSNRAAS